MERQVRHAEGEAGPERAQAEPELRVGSAGVAFAASSKGTLDPLACLGRNVVGDTNEDTMQIRKRAKNMVFGRELT